MNNGLKKRRILFLLLTALEWTERRKITYDDFLKIRAIGQALLNRGLSPERPVALILTTALIMRFYCYAMHVGIRPAYLTRLFLMSQDFGKLKFITEWVTPGLVFAEMEKSL